MARTRPLLLLAAALALAFAAGACGGGANKGDDLSDIQGTATAAAAKRPPPTATPDPVTAYREKVVAGTTRLTQLADQMSKDMLATADSQADPKWPGILNADADQVTQLATDLQKLAAPADTRYAAFAKQLATATDSLIKAARLLKQAVITADVATGTQAFETLTAGTQQLADAAKTFPGP